MAFRLASRGTRAAARAAQAGRKKKRRHAREGALLSGENVTGVVLRVPPQQAERKNAVIPAKAGIHFSAVRQDGLKRLRIEAGRFAPHFVIPAQAGTQAAPKSAASGVAGSTGFAGTASRLTS